MGTVVPIIKKSLTNFQFLFHQKNRDLIKKNSNSKKGANSPRKKKTLLAMFRTDVLQFVLRMTVFAVSFYYMAEFALLSKVDTSVGLAVIVVIITVILLHTLLNRSRSVVECPVCTNRMIK